MKKLVPVETSPTRLGLSTVRKMHAKEMGDLYECGSGEVVTVGIDAALTKYGLSVYGTGTGKHTTVLFKPKYKGPRRLHEIFDFISFTINFLERNFHVGEIVMEDYAPGAVGKTYSIGEGGGATKLALAMRYGHEEKVAYPTLPKPNQLKKYVTGKGGADKNQMLMQTYKKWGIEFPSDDMSDAYGLARLGAALLSGTTDYAYEAEVVAALERNTEWVPTK